MRPRFKISPHAAEVMRRRGVDVEDVVSAIVEPDLTEPQRDGRRRFIRGRLCVVARVDRASVVVVTCLLRGASTTWTDQTMRSALSA